jgi:hypothetical protein
MSKHLAFLGLYLSSVMVAMMGFFTIGPELETRLWPAYGKFRLVSVEASGDGLSRAVFDFEKKRECTPAGFAWFNGELGSSYQIVDYEVEGPGGNGVRRPVGFHRSSPYLIEATPDDVRTRLLGEIYSRCHPFWVTRSEVYP